MQIRVDDLVGCRSLGEGETKEELDAQRQYVVIGTLALLFV